MINLKYGRWEVRGGLASFSLGRYVNNGKIINGNVMRNLNLNIIRYVIYFAKLINVMS